LDLDKHPQFPACLPRSNVICVMATDAAGRVGRYRDSEGQWKEFSNYGAKSVHVAAPGTLIAGVAGKDQTRLENGTSFAAPMVTATVAVLLAEHSNWDAKQIVHVLTSTASPRANLQSKCQSMGLLQIESAMKWSENH